MDEIYSDFEVLSYALTIILILYGGYMVIQGEITLGDLVKVNGYLWMLTAPLRMAGWWINDIQRFTTSIEKIYDTYTKEPSIKTPEKVSAKRGLGVPLSLRMYPTVRMTQISWKISISR